MTEVGTLKLVHEDMRRAIREYNGEDFSITDFMISRRIPLGDHFHARKREVFTIIDGEGYVVLKDTRDDSVPVIHPLQTGSVVAIDPFMAHTFVLDVGSQMQCMSSERFNPEDQDMTYWPLRYPIRHIASVIVVYRATDPSQIYIDIKDDGLPVKVFRRTLCPVGGNWIGNAAASDRSPLETAKRELLEEISFERPARSMLELKQLGLADQEVMASTSIQDPKPSAVDIASLEDLKHKMVSGLEAFGDYIVSVSADTFKIGDPDNQTGAMEFLVSYYTVGLREADWTMLTSLQRRFGNLSNESISTICSLKEIAGSKVHCAYGHEWALGDFFKSYGFADVLDAVPCTSAKRIGLPLASYTEYEKQFDIARKPA